MSLTMRKLYLIIIGLLSGLAVWPVMEFVLIKQTEFSSYLIFSIVTGVIFGAVVGAVFASSSGIIISNFYRLSICVLNGLLIGALGGIAGFFISQFILFAIGETVIHSMKDYSKFGLPVARAIGWGTLGIFIGTVDGLRSVSWTKIKMGIIGGFLGGLFGGLILEYLKYFYPMLAYARLAGFIILGGFIGLFYSLIERKMSFGKLFILNGKKKSSEFLINQRTMKIGSSRKNDIILSYNNVENYHAELQFRKGKVFLINKIGDDSVKVNDDLVTKKELRLDDVIKIGNVKFLYRY